MKLRIVVAEHGATLRPCVREALQRIGDLALQSAAEVQTDPAALPDLILICGASGVRAESLMACAPEDMRVPAIVMLPPGRDELAAACLRAGADLCVPEGISAELLVAQCEALAAKTRLRCAASPLTGLPGNTHLEREIARRLPERGELALLACDLNDFKAYNDRYGYAIGDRLLCWLSQLLCEVVSHEGAPDSSVAHIGGDDFFVLTHPRCMCRIAEAAISRFDVEIVDYYEQDDRLRGGIISRTRTGDEAFFPLSRLVIAGVTNEGDDIAHVGQLSQIIAELKAYGKRMGRSVFVPDRRFNHGSASR